MRNPAGARAARAAGVALLAALLLTACDDAPEDTAEAPAPGSEVQEAAAQPEPAAPAAEPEPAEPQIVESTGQPVPETFTLENGMQVVVIEDHRAPVVTHMVWYKVGAADEPEGVSGIAHFLEHLMFKGTEKIAPGEFSKIIARNGGKDNAFTSQDFTAYYQRVASDRLPLVMEMEADRMSNLQLTDEVVLPERDVILEERSMRIDNDPGSQLAEQMDAMLHLAHPYGTPVIGWEHEMRALTRDEAIAYYNTYYTPNNAILIVAGDITAEELRPLAEKYYGVVARRAEPPARIRNQDPPQRAARRVALKDARVEQPYVRREYIAPSYNTAEPGEAEALDVLGEILGGGATARIYKTLVVEDKTAVGAGAWYSGTALDEGGFGFYAIPAADVSLDDAEAAIDAVIANLLENGVTEEEVEQARQSLWADAVYAQDSQQALARSYGMGLTTGADVAEIATWPDRVLAVTAEDVMKAARKYLVPEASVTGLLLREDKQI